jgi:23S rRNA (guanosine2251-2'-O)-methyltransferase
VTKNSGKENTKEKNTDILFGFHSVYEALKAGRRRFETLFISRSRSCKRGDKIVSLADSAGIKVSVTDAGYLDELTGSDSHQGIAARTSVFPVHNGSEIVSWIKQQQTPYWALVVDQIEDPQNLGALIRTALCTGVDIIIIPKDRSALPTPGVSRASAGAMEHARIFVVTNTAATLRTLKQHQAWIAGLDAKADTLLSQADLTGHLAMVVGGEHKGIRPGVLKECDFLVSIPITGPVNSLNASVAGGMAMYEGLRQRTICSVG